MLGNAAAWPPIVQTIVDAEVERLVRDRLSAGDRDDVAAVVLMYAPNAFPREALPEYGVCWESLVEDAPADDDDRWNWAHLEDVGSSLLSDAAVATIEPAVGAAPPVGSDVMAWDTAVIDRWFATLARAVRRLHRHGLITELFGRRTPIVVSDLVADERCALASVLANGRDIADPFVRYCFGRSAIPARSIPDTYRSRVATVLGAAPATWPDAFALADQLHHQAM